MNLPLLIGVMVVKILVVFVVFLTTIAYVVLMERKVLGFIQFRYGPNRVGPWGLLQPLADAIKLIFKEDFTPPGASKALFVLAPMIVGLTAFLPLAVIPFADKILPDSVTIYGQTLDLTVASLNRGVIADINIGVLYVFAVAGMAVYGAVIGGWSSNNKYSLLGALRLSAQMISYELALGLSIIGVLMLAGTLSLVKIVEAQKHYVVYCLPAPGFPPLPNCRLCRMRQDTF